MAEAGGPESAAARCPDESSDSEPEQEPGTPQKLIRKVSTSGQIRSKVKSVRRGVFTGGSDLWSVFSFGGGGPFRAPGSSVRLVGDCAAPGPTAEPQRVGNMPH